MILDCSSDSGCNGGSITTSLAYAASSGLCTDTDYPYQGSQGTCGSASCAIAAQPASYNNVASSSQTALEDAVRVQPVVVGVTASGQNWQLYSGGVMTSLCGTSVDHAVLVVGFGTDATAGDFYNIKNSWGTSWGEAGFIRLGRGAAYNPSGQCGVQLDPAVPTSS